MPWLLRTHKRSDVWHDEYLKLLELLDKKGIELKFTQLSFKPPPERISRSVLLRLERLLRQGRYLRGSEVERMRLNLLRGLRHRWLRQRVSPVSSNVAEPAARRLRLRGKQSAKR
jgi:hypothetical protein